MKSGQLLKFPELPKKPDEPVLPPVLPDAAVPVTDLSTWAAQMKRVILLNEEAAFRQAERQYTTAEAHADSMIHTQLERCHHEYARLHALLAHALAQTRGRGFFTDRRMYQPPDATYGIAFDGRLLGQQLFLHNAQQQGYMCASANELKQGENDTVLRTLAVHVAWYKVNDPNAAAPAEEEQQPGLVEEEEEQDVPGA